MMTFLMMLRVLSTNQPILMMYAPFLCLLTTIFFSFSLFLGFFIYFFGKHGTIPYLFRLALSCFFQICKFVLAPDATPIVDEQLLEDVSHAARSSVTKAPPSMGKHVAIMRRKTSPHRLGIQLQEE